MVTWFFRHGVGHNLVWGVAPVVNCHQGKHLMLGAFFYGLAVNSDCFASHDEEVNQET